MKGLPLLALRSVVHHRTQSIILVLCLAVTLTIPAGVALGLRAYESALVARADATPLVAGARGYRFDLVLAALAFRRADQPSITWGDARALGRDGEALVIPLHLMHTARGRPLVGTGPEYFELRGLHAARGTLPLVLGEAVLGADVSDELGLDVGDTITSDPTGLYDVASPGSLTMHVSGVLSRSGTADDHAVFVDVHTAWVVDGLLHGHAEATAVDPKLLLGRDAEHVAVGPALVEEQEVTERNLASFHLHGDPDACPLSALLLVPRDRKAATLLSARLGDDDRLVVLRPRDVVDELLAYVLRIEALVDGLLWSLGLATLLLVGLVLLLSVRLRRGEIATLRHLGAAPSTVVRLLALEVALLVLAALSLSGAVLAVGAAWLPDLARVV
ncbi:MAG: hypothetical protein H6825_10460 [Planctomycetes bacterium]|nr:hypothetical protein [Planctomycetota bacterium]